MLSRDRAANILSFLSFATGLKRKSEIHGGNIQVSAIVVGGKAWVNARSVLAIDLLHQIQLQYVVSLIILQSEM